jgi:type IV pilus biogenesis protein CpaD/CtpE
MGTNFSKQLVDQTQTIISQALTDITTNVDNSLYGNVGSWQRIDMDLTGANIKRCPITVGQDSQVASEILSQADTTVANDVSQRLEGTLEALVAQTLDQVNKSIPLGANNSADVRTKITQSVNQLLKTSLVTNINNLMYTTTGNNQIVNFRGRYLLCRNSPITINQTSVIDAVSRSTATNVVTNIVKNEAAAGIKAEVDQKVKQANTGLDFGFIFIILALVAFAVLYFFFKHNPIKKGAQLVQDGAKAAGEAVVGTTAAVTGVGKSKMKPILITTSIIGTITSVLYGLTRSGVISNPLAPEAAQ